jgi:hypothetical protein
MKKVIGLSDFVDPADGRKTTFPRNLALLTNAHRCAHPDRFVAVSLLNRGASQLMIYTNVGRERLTL